MNKVYIYGLICPKTNCIKYVGKTIQSLNSRLKGHLHVNKDDLTYRANWIRSLKNDSLIPIIFLIEKCTDSDWIEREIYWIGYYSKLYVLTNHSKGGVGGHVVSISTREKKSIEYIEKWKDVGYKEKMSLMSKNSWNENRKIMTSNRIKGLWEDNDYKEKMSLIIKKRWENEDYRNNRLTDESKEKIRLARLNTTLSQETKDKIGTKSKELWENNKEAFTISRFKLKVIIDGIEYGSMKSASIALNVDSSTITRRIKSDKFKNYKLKGSD